MIVICDLDGTLALDHHRHHHLNKPCDGCDGGGMIDHDIFRRECPTCKGKGIVHDWDKYFAACEGDILQPNIAVLLEDLRDAGHKIYILTGRSDSVVEKTLLWLQRYEVIYDHLFMRAEDDRTDDHKLKIGWGAALGGPSKVLCVIEDRTRVVKAWREAGYTCLQCAQGDF